MISFPRFAGAAALAAALFVACPAFADRNVLWNIVHGECVPAAEAGKSPNHCVDVNLSGGDALLKDLNGVAQELAIPTTRITGIEDPLLLDPKTPNYFEYAWKERVAAEALLKKSLPRDAFGVAVNSMYSRSQDQLHLHVDCMDKDVVADLKAHLGEIGTTFKPMSSPLKGRTYVARRVSETELAAASPFGMLADGVEGARAQMGAWSLILIGADLDGAPGFVLLADHADPLGGGHAEVLQDHNCAIASTS